MRMHPISGAAALRSSAAVDDRQLPSRLAAMNQTGIEAEGGYAAALARGAAAKEKWFTSGDLVPARALADRWGLTLRALGSAVKDGEIFALVRRRRRYHPSEFLDLSRSAVGDICRALAGLSPETQFIFWKRQHGALGGKTVFDYLRSRSDSKEQVHRVVELAQAWAAEAAGR
jgi:hypothetical protein